MDHGQVTHSLVVIDGHGQTTHELLIYWEAKNQRRRILPLHSELDALSWAMECMQQLSTCHNFGTDCKDLISMIQDPGSWPNFSTWLKELLKLKCRFMEFCIAYIPRSENVSSDSLAKIARSFHRDLYYIGCSVPIWKNFKFE